MRVQTVAIALVSFMVLTLSARAQSSEENKKVITRYLLEIFNGRKLDLVGEVFPEKFVRHDLNDSTDTWMTIADQQKRLSDLFLALPVYFIPSAILWRKEIRLSSELCGMAHKKVVL